VELHDLTRTRERLHERLRPIDRLANDRLDDLGELRGTRRREEDAFAPVLPVLAFALRDPEIADCRVRIEQIARALEDTLDRRATGMPDSLAIKPAVRLPKFPLGVQMTGAGVMARRASSAIAWK